jgi:sugar phosphate isomerase/epimerase
MKHSCFTVALTDLTYKDLARILAEAGYDGVEWRVTPPKEDAEMKHLNLHRIEEQAREVKGLCDELGLEIPVIGSYEEIQNTERIERLFKLAHLLGTKLVRVNTRWYQEEPHFDVLFKETIERLQNIMPIAKEYGVKPIFELHMGTIFPGPSDARRIIDNFTPDEIGITFDPGNMVTEGRINDRLGIQILGPYLAHVHVKNAGWFRDEDGSWKSGTCPVDDGMVDWPTVIECLKDAGYNGYLSQEDFHSFKYTPDELTPETKPGRIEYVRDTLVRNKAYLDKCLMGEK